MKSYGRTHVTMLICEDQHGRRHNVMWTGHYNYNNNSNNNNKKRSWSLIMSGNHELGMKLECSAKCSQTYIRLLHPVEVTMQNAEISLTIHNRLPGKIEYDLGPVSRKTRNFSRVFWMTWLSSNPRLLQHEKTSFTQSAGRSFRNGLSCPKSLGRLSRNGPLFWMGQRSPTRLHKSHFPDLPKC